MLMPSDSRPPRLFLAEIGAEDESSSFQAEGKGAEEVAHGCGCF